MKTLPILVDGMHPDALANCKAQTNFVRIVIYNSIFTFSTDMIFWQHELASRIEEALETRGIEYDFSMSDFWGWYFFGSSIILGPYILLPQTLHRNESFVRGLQQGNCCKIIEIFLYRRLTTQKLCDTMKYTRERKKYF